MEHETGTRRYNAGRQDDGVQRKHGRKGCTREADKPNNQQGIRAIKSSKISCITENSASTEKKDCSTTECNKKCTKQNQIGGMFGFICTRCNYDDLGSLTEY